MPALRPPKRGWLPTGRHLSASEAAWRHSVVCLVTLAHVPPLLAAAAVTGQSRGMAGPGAALALVALAVGPFGHRVRGLLATTALLTCSLVLVALFPGRPELYTHVFVVVALIALYQNWSMFSLAVVSAVVEVTVVRGLLLGDSNLWWALVRGGFVLAEAAVLVVFWRADERARAGEATLLVALWEGQASVRARLEETERIRTDLIGTVSHEFRTPLTCVRAGALTLLKHGDRLDERGRRTLLQGLLDQQERLSRLLENMLTASRATAPDPDALTEVVAVATEVAMIAGASRPQSQAVSVVIEPDTLARIDRHALHQILANLVDNAQQHGLPGTAPLIAGGYDDDGVWVAVSNEGGPIDPITARNLFEPFTQGETGPTRGHEGLGMGLYVVRRLVEVYGGAVNVLTDGGWVTVEVRLKAASNRRRLVQEPTAVPIP